MKFRTFIISLTAIVILLLLTAGAGAAWMVVNSPVTKLQRATVASPATAVFVSRQSPFVASLRVNPDRLMAAKLLTVPAQQRGQVRDSFAQLQKAFLPDTQLSYSRDIQPWLGDEITLAITTADFDRDRSNGDQMGYLVAMTTSNPTLAQQTLKTFWQRHVRAKDRVSEAYAGVEIMHRNLAKNRNPLSQTESLDAPTLASAVVGDRFVLLANSPKVLREAINNVQVAELSLENSEAYQQALDQLPQSAIGLTWVNLPQLWAMGSAAENVAPNAASVLASWNLDASPEGRLADLMLLPAAGSSFSSSSSSVNSSELSGALRYIPAASIFAATGADLQSQLETEWVGDVLAQWVEQWIERSLNDPAQPISLSEGLGWITGDYALALLPQNQGLPNPADWVFVTRKSPELLAGLEKLDAIAQKHNVTLGSFSLDTPVGNQEIFAWTKFSPRSLKPSKTSSQPSAMALTTEVQGVRTAVGDYEIFATSLEAMNWALQPSENSLLQKADFQRAIAPLARNNQGYIYLEQPMLRSLIKQFSSQIHAAITENSSLDQWLDQWQSLAFSSYGQTDRVAKGAISIQSKIN
ncbi:MAG: DUF3352 domain-containing protein [Oscillatoriophycideae cyanobacterium NC_groundwater_1537_Pr4_S-0.65um_50_18]|nr:DUF3352 domain-containing protein [Oscillatoriophycideae cyanobacterium NC_groundwater_1537_Pr4_S-0.65um_50_18]